MSKKSFPLILLVLLLPGCGRDNIRTVIKASGTIEIREVDLSSRISSRISRLNADEGAAVKKGDVIAELDDRIVKAQKDSAQAMFVQAQDNYRRSKQLYNAGTIPQQQFEQATAFYIKSESDLKQTEIMCEEARITAPWDGTIMKKHVETGELVSPNTPLFTLGDLLTAKIKIYIPLPDLGKIRLNQAGRIRIDSYKDRWFEGKITFISSEAEFTPKNIQTEDERVKEVFEVEVTVANPEYILKPGMPADVEILAGPKEKTKKKKN
ncbi:MAG: efflux RND transporter periplasmic adaptor subunit [bacterium]|nr:efflux RND transporter periplasmic adaptor subunit [bacterium]